MDTVTSRRRDLAVAAVVGAGAGGLSGLFGVGGGILIVPGLILWVGMEQKRAHATSLLAIVPIAAAGALGYAVEGAVDWPAAGILVLGAAAGTLLGTLGLHRIPDRALRVIFAFFLLAAAAALPFEVTATEAPSLDVTSAILLGGVGLLAGAMAGLLGVGGGIVMVPGLVLLVSLSQATARGTSLAAIVPIALAGTVANLRRGYVDLGAAASAGAAGIVSAYVVSLLAVRMDPVLSAILFGLLLVAVAVRLLLSARGRPVPGDR